MHNLFGNQNLDKAVAVSILVLILLISYMLFSNIYLDGLREIDSEKEILRKKTERVDSILASEKSYQAEIQKVKKK
jgi:hypothetical protein